MAPLNFRSSPHIQKNLDRAAKVKNLLILIVFNLVAILPMASHAQHREYSKQLNSCLDNSGGVTQIMVDCIKAEISIQDARLNTAYKSLMGTLNSERKKQLQEVQRAWIKFRTLNCAFHNNPDGGTISRIHSNDCVLSMTANRANELETLINEQ